MKTNSSFHAAGEVATQPAWGTGEQAAQPLNGSTSRFAMSESSLADLLQKAASQYPNRAAYKFIDYDTDPAGFTETVTWWQVHRRAMIVAEELWIYASSGDRVAILAPQGLEYIIAFMGVLQAGLIAVPLPVPQFGIHDERISSALRDSAPSIILTTSSVIDEVTTYAPHACAAQGQSAPIVVAVDALDLSSSRALDPTRFERPSTAYLQYTSGSTRAPAGVVLSHKNVITNCVQLMSDYIGDSEKVPSTPVSWLPFYHDMGLMLGIILPMINQGERLVALRQERQRLVVDAVCAEAAKMLGEPDPWSVDQDLAFSELGFDSQMTVTLCKRLAAVTGLRLPETVGWDYGSISGLAQYLEAELAGGHGRLKSAGPVNSGATGLWAIEEQLNKVEELVAVIADGEKQRVADRLRALLGTIAGSEAGLGKLIQAASTPDEIFQLIDSELGK